MTGLGDHQFLEELGSAGATRIRSNVIQERHIAWEWVPGELVERAKGKGWFRRPLRGRRIEQHDEKMYYRPCAECKRTVTQVELEGCTCPHAPSTERVVRRKREHDYVIAQIRELEDKLNAGMQGRRSD